jgi:transcriptional regulator
MPRRLSVLKGTLDMLVLKALTWRSMHGFELTRFLEERSEQRLDLEDAALYQALYRMEKRGLVRAEWGVTGENRRARFYRITPAGKAELNRQASRWLRYAETVTRLVTELPKGR